MKTTFAVSPVTNLKVGLVIHPTETSLLKAYGSRSDTTSEGVVAFCTQPSVVLDGTVAEIHLSAEDVSLNTVVHECQHASLQLAAYMRLKLENDEAEEFLAAATACIVCSVMSAVRRLRASKRPAKSRRQNCGPSSS